MESGPAGVRVETESGEISIAKDLLFAAAPQHLARLRGLAIPESLEGAQLKINMLLSRLPRLKSGVDPRLAFAGTFHVNESFSQLEAACAETDDPHIYLAGAGARRGGGVSGIAGHNAAMALLGKS